MQNKYYTKYISLFVIMALYAVLSTTLFNLVDIPFDSDEAVHALEGLQIASDIYHIDIASFLNHFYFTEWYPPLLSTYLALFFVFLKPSYWSARYSILLLAIIYTALMYRVSSKLAKNEKSGLITLLLVATSPIVWIQSLLCMEETLAMIGVLVTVMVFIQADRKKIHPAWVGLCMAVTMLIRLSIGIYVAGAIAIVFGLDWLKNGKLRLDHIFRMVLPFIVICAIWWGHPVKIKNLINYVQASPPAYESLSWYSLSYYWYSIVTTSTVSPLIGIVVLISFISSILHRREKPWSLPLAIVVATWIVLLIKRQLNLRFFISALSSLFLITGQSITKFYTLISANKIKWFKISFQILALVIVIISIPFMFARIASFPFLMEIAYETDSDSIPLYNWISDNVDKETPIFLVNGWDQLSSAGLNFFLGMAKWSQWQSPKVTDVFLADPDKKPQLVNQFDTALKSTSTSFVVHLANSPVPNAGAWWAYAPALQACWHNDWQSTTSYWIHLWDENLKDRIMHHPFQYTDGAERLVAREKYWYPLLIEVKVAECQYFRE